MAATGTLQGNFELRYRICGRKYERWFSGTNSGNASGLFPIAILKAGNYVNRNVKIEYTSAPSALRFIEAKLDQQRYGWIRLTNNRYTCHRIMQRI
jgi:hypothetical protein